MTDSQDQSQRQRDELLQLLSVSATLAGLCVTVVALMKTLGDTHNAATIVDDMFALCALIFLSTTYLIFWALKTGRPGRVKLLVKLLDISFLVGLTLMTAAAFILVYTVW